MADNTQQIETILKLGVDYQEGIKAVGQYINEIKRLKEQQSELDAQVKYNQISEKAYGEAMAANKATMTQLKGEMKVLTNEIRHKLEADRADAKQIDINTASYNKLSETYKQMKQRINEMSAAERQQNKAYIEQSKQVYERMKTLQAETGKMQLNVGNYNAAITQLITGNSKFASSLMGLAGGANSASGALGIVNQQAMALGRTLMTLMTNPVFLAIAGVAAAGAAFKFWKDYNEGLAEATRLTQQFTGLAGDGLDKVRDAVQATADTFGKDFKETLQGADTLVSQYGISWKEATDIINKGFAAGADMNGDFLANIKQYGPALKDAGLSAEELVAVIQQTRSGVFGKDGLDAITKASKSLRDMSSSTAESLKAVGINADDLKNRLANGSITMMQAIQEVSTALKGVGANSQEAGAIISDVFGKKGVAAGQAQIKAIADLNMSLDSLIESEGEYGKVQQELVNTQEELNSYTAELFGMDGWDVMKKKAELLAKKGLLAIMKGLVGVINYMIDWYNSSMVLRGVINSIIVGFKNGWEVIKFVFSAIVEAVKSVANQLRGFGDIVEGVFTLKWDKIAKGWDTIANGFTGSWKNMTANAFKLGSTMAENTIDGWNKTMNGSANKLTAPVGLDAYTGGVEMDTTSSGAGGSGGSSGSGGKSGKGSGKSATGKAGTGNAAKDVDKQAEAIRKATEKAQQMMLKNYDDYTKQQVQAAQKRYDLLLATVKKGSEEELALKKKQLDLQQEQEVASVEASVQNEMERAYLVQLVYEKYAQEKAQLEAQYIQAQNDAMVQAVTNEFTQRIQSAADNELEQERIKLEQAQWMRDNARQKEGESIEAFNARKLQLEQEYQDEKRALTQKEIEIEQAKYDAIESIAGGIGKVFQALGEENRDFAVLSKVLALAEIAINTGKAIAAGVAQAQSVPFPANIAAIATTVATILANIATAISTVNSAKFAKGGLIQGAGTGTSDSITARVSNGESIMTANATALFSPLLSAINQMGGGVPIMHGGMASQVGEDMLAAAIAKGYAMAPSPVVSVREITDVGNRVKVIEEMATT